ncbi:hypothetical protein [Streptomyces sp. STCH 565 A]|uniref:hypothetical protein n=1 Tax=Streptomyces sp. STCH 565 A TaxID=2950532 RepID=UPI002074C100|nr:hypothetical protein [Streptomyces sp. STCH 565 A]MCM8552298.1 hypothetical protein [Streptomyces sp. STCH 565 A]
MASIEAAAIVAAGTAAVLAPVDPTLFRQVAAPEPATLPNFTAILAAHAYLRAQAATAAKVAKHLGYSTGWTPRPHTGETPTRVNAWDQHELNDFYERLGGTATSRQTDDGTLEITLTVQVPDVGPVQIVTDWDAPAGGHDLPLMQALAIAPYIRHTSISTTIHGTVISHELEITPGAPLPDGKTIASVEDPKGSAWRVTDTTGGIHWLAKNGTMLRYSDGYVTFIVPEWAYAL